MKKGNRSGGGAGQAWASKQSASTVRAAENFRGKFSGVMFMKNASTDSQRNGATEAAWPRMPKIAGAEFEQSVAVAQLALKLWEDKIARLNSKPLEKENVKDKGPKEFLGEAWELIQGAREHVLREQTNAEYFAEHCGSHEAAEKVVGRILSASLVPFKKLCNPNRNKGNSERIRGVIWKVFTTKRGFDDLFCAYWDDIGEKWRNPTTRKDHGMLKTDAIKPDGTPQRVQMHSEDERQALAALAGNENKWKESGQQVLASWKRYGVPPNDFIALAKFRSERDKKRVWNLEKRVKRKDRRPTRNRRAQS